MKEGRRQRGRERCSARAPLGTEAPEMLVPLATKAPSPTGLDGQAGKTSPRAPLAALLPDEPDAGRTQRVPGRSCWDLQGAQGKSGVCHPRRSWVKAVSQQSIQISTPTLPLAQTRQLRPKTQMSPSATRALSRIEPRLFRTRLLGRREALTSRRPSPAKHCGADGSRLETRRAKAVSAWHFWPRGRANARKWRLPFSTWIKQLARKWLYFPRYHRVGRISSWATLCWMKSRRDFHFTERELPCGYFTLPSPWLQNKQTNTHRLPALEGTCTGLNTTAWPPGTGQERERQKLWRQGLAAEWLLPHPCLHTNDTNSHKSFLSRTGTHFRKSLGRERTELVKPSHVFYAVKPH